MLSLAFSFLVCGCKGPAPHGSEPELQQTATDGSAVFGAYPGSGGFAAIPRAEATQILRVRYALGSLVVNIDSVLTNGSMTSPAPWGHHRLVFEGPAGDVTLGQDLGSDSFQPLVKASAHDEAFYAIRYVGLSSAGGDVPGVTGHLLLFDESGVRELPLPQIHASGDRSKTSTFVLVPLAGGGVRIYRQSFEGIAWTHGARPGELTWLLDASPASFAEASVLPADLCSKDGR